MSISRNDLFGLPIIIVDGRVDFYHCNELLQVLDRAIEEGHKTIAVDLSGVTVLDESGTQLLYTLSECIAHRGGRLRVVGASVPARRGLARGPVLVAA